VSKGIVGAQPVIRRNRELADLHLDLGEGQQGLQYLADRVALPRADVVDRARLPVLEGKPVGADHVPHVGEVANRLEVAHVDHRPPQSLLDLGDLAGEVRGDEDLAPPGAAVVEPSSPDGVEAVASPVLVREQVLGDLRDRVGRQGPQGVLFADGHLVRLDQAVLLARPGDVDLRLEAQVSHRLEHVELRLHVGQEGLGRHEPGGRHVALGRQVEDAVGPHRGERPPGGRGIAEVALDERDAPAEVLDVVHAAPPAMGPEQLHVAPADEVVGQVASDKARQAGDEDSHGASSSKKAWMEATTVSTSASVSSGKQGRERTSRAAAQAAGRAPAS